MQDSPEQAPALLDTFRGLLLAGRWLMLLVQAAEAAYLFWTARLLPVGAWPVLGALFLYTAVSVAAIHRLPVRKVPVSLLLATDLFLVGVAAWYTGGTASRLLGQCYLIIFAAALVYDLRGGIGAALAAAAVVLLLAGGQPASARAGLQNLIPYFLLTGTFTGHLVGRLKTWFHQYHLSTAQQRRRDVEEETIRRELELARSIQAAALPSAPPAVAGLELASRSVLPRQVGGDLLLFLEEGERLGVVVGDVSGKGIPAALVSTSIGHLLPWLQPMADPLRALRDLNRDLNSRIPDDAFVSAVLADVDLGRGEVRLWTAGHPPALLWKSSEGRGRQSQVHNQVLGALRDLDCEPETWTLEPGDVLVLYTDGLTEVRSLGGELFDLGRVAAAVGTHCRAGAEEIASAVVAAARAWGELSDDLTLVVCKRTETVQKEEGGTAAG